MLFIEKSREKCCLDVTKRRFSHAIAFLYGKRLRLALFESAKEFRTVKFYNKELKWPLLICKIDIKRLKYHVVWHFLSIGNAKLEKRAAASVM